jgi:hypothetical protein
MSITIDFERMPLFAKMDKLAPPESGIRWGSCDGTAVIVYTGPSNWYVETFMILDHEQDRTAAVSRLDHGWNALERAFDIEFGDLVPGLIQEEMADAE